MSRVFAVIALSFLAGSMAEQVTPMEKVIELLKDLSAKVTEEGKKEAAEYDKYACFCKEQASDKLYAIEKSDKKIAKLKAQIEELEASIAGLNSDIATLSKEISGLEKEIKEKTEKREAEHEVYLGKAKDMNEAIAACEAAIAALKDSKKELKGAKLDLAQVKGATSKLVAALAARPLLAEAPGAASLLSKLGTNAAPKFVYQSNDIIAVLEDLLATFKKMKKDLDVEEFDINAAFESDKLGLTNEKTFKEKDKAEKEAIVATKTETMETAKTDKDEETADRDADQNFMDVLTKDCEEKAGLFDQRSLTRADELKALSEATAELQKGAAPNYAVNKKLVGLQKKADGLNKAVSFVQINNVQHDQSKRQIALQKAMNLLKDRAANSKSSTLATLALRMTASEDHFVKVRGLIKDLVAKLKADAVAEADQKSVCDKGMAKATTDRDDANAVIEDAEGKITTYSANKKEKEEEIKETEGQIADLKKALLEAAELRAEDKATNAKSLEMTGEAIAAVKSALKILGDFYGNALVQTGKYVPPDSDREGNTVGDLAPEVFSADYHGAQAESKGIVGILEVILSDFERTEGKTQEDEELSKMAYEMFETDTNAEVKEKNKKVKTLEGEVADLESKIVDQEQAKKDAEALLQSAKDALDDLEAMCVKGEETWEERKKKRMEEIAALKEALSILEDWQA
jgi:predicted  nucleic acid-binding Zn-ribbon protein